MGDALRMRVRCDSYAPKVVREALEQLPDVADGCPDALVVASELVTNAVRHSCCPKWWQLTIYARRRQDHLHFSVKDPGLSGGRAEIADRPVQEGGLGLKVVDQLSERWGSERLDDGYRVWAEVPLAS